MAPVAEEKKVEKRVKKLKAKEKSQILEERRPSLYDPNRVRKMGLLGEDELTDFGKHQPFCLFLAS